MKRALLLSGAAILLLGITQNFDGQGKSQDHRQMSNEGNRDTARQSKMVQALFFSRQEPNRWNADQTLPDRHRMTKQWDHRDDRANAMMSGNTFVQHELSAGIDTAWVRRYSSDVFGGEDGAAAMVIDDSGNVYVTGASEGREEGHDFATIKYNVSGVRQWVARYHGTGNAENYASALAVDAFGNVYVTGTSQSSSTAEDFATIKYNSAGVEQWTARYDGTGNLGDGASALAVDASGNVYVTGISQSSSTAEDFATIKYNSAGVEQWAARYSWSENSYDYASAIAVDDSGNVYVTGASQAPAIGRDYATVKYNSAGFEQWVALYNGPGNAGDQAEAVAVDVSGNVYVTGGSRGSGTESDFATIKYNSAGLKQWVVRYNGPGNLGDGASALAVDASGNVYVTGTSQSSNTADDFATIKYNSVGALQWVMRYNGPRNLHDHASALAVDGVGNVYVTGWSASPDTENESDFATVKYNSTGVVQWVARYDGRDNGRHRWNNSDYAIAVAVDYAGNVHVAGTVGDSEWRDWPVRSKDYATIKYNASGEAQWAAIYSGPKIDYNYATDLAIDKFGSIYVSGYSTNGSDAAYVIIKYDAAGAIQWIDRCREGYQGTKLVVDGSGNAYVTGFGDRGGYITVKYNVSGARQWVAHFQSGQMTST
ncbi:MAG: hypothetical protein DKINENOH_05409 [bacterium]|nr:hypothetical protein [bacterium]